MFPARGDARVLGGENGAVLSRSRNGLQRVLTVGFPIKRERFISDH